MDKKYIVTKSDFDASMGSKDIVIGDDAVFVIIASSIINYIEDGGFDESDKNLKKILKKLLTALKSGKWENLLEPANTFLSEMGNGETFEVSDYVPEADRDYSEEYTELMARCEELKLKDLFDDDWDSNESRDDSEFTF